MAKYIAVKELKRRKSNLAKIESVCEFISHLKSGCSWVLTGYTDEVEFESLILINEGKHWNTLLQSLPPDKICYAYARVEFGKLPGAFYLIIWIGEGVKEVTKLTAQENEKKLPSLFPNYDDIMHARTRVNLQKQIVGKLMPTRRGSKIFMKRSDGFRLHFQDEENKEFAFSSRKRTETVIFPNREDGLKSVNSWPLSQEPRQDSSELLAKVIVIGDVGVGKTSIIRKYINSNEATQTSPSRKKEIYTRREKIGQVFVNLKIWDTMGGEKYASLPPIWYRYAEAAILVYDKTNRQSFEHIKQCLERVKTYSDPCSTILVGNKLDLSIEEVISKKEAFSFSFVNGLMFIETCAKDNTNIHELFSLLSKRLVSKLMDLQQGCEGFNRCRMQTVIDGQMRGKKHTTIKDNQNIQDTPNIKLNQDENSQEILEKCFN